MNMKELDWRDVFLKAAAPEPDWRDVLLKAASIVEEGWCQGAMHRRKDGTRCVDTTLVYAVQDDAELSCATGALGRAFVQLTAGISDAPLIAAIGNLSMHLDSGITSWNDHPDRTAVEVAEVMRQVATS